MDNKIEKYAYEVNKTGSARCLVFLIDQDFPITNELTSSDVPLLAWFNLNPSMDK